MNNKDLIIIALIVVIVYLVYQNQASSQSPLIVESPITQQLRSELNHYQTLYQKRVEKDLGFEQENKETQTEDDQLKIQHQEQLRKINVLFDEQAKDYSFIDFNDLYALLSQIAERESKSSDDEDEWHTPEEE